jgi:hypothetical protein
MDYYELFPFNFFIRISSVTDNYISSGSKHLIQKNILTHLFDYLN